MPYIFKEELDEGEEAADVVTREDMETALAGKDSEIGKLQGQLDDAKKRFADAFLSSPEKAKRDNFQEMKREERKKPVTFGTLFRERTKHAD